MDFALTPELIELRARVRALVDDHLQPFEWEAESTGGRLSAESHAAHQAGRARLGPRGQQHPQGVRRRRLQPDRADRHPRAARPADQLPVGARVEPVQRARPRHARADRALPAARRARRAPPRLRDHRGGGRLRPARDHVRGGLERQPLRALRQQVVRHRRRRRELLHRARVGGRRARPPPGAVPGRQGPARGRDDGRSGLHPQLPLPPSRVHVHEDAGAAPRTCWASSAAGSS